MNYWSRLITVAQQSTRSLVRKVILRFFRTQSKPVEMPNQPIYLHPKDIETLKRLISLEQGERYRITIRKPTDDEVVLAAWGNLSIEEPDVTIQDARRAILGTQ